MHTDGEKQRDGLYMLFLSLFLVGNVLQLFSPHEVEAYLLERTVVLLSHVLLNSFLEILVFSFSLLILLLWL